MVEARREIWGGTSGGVYVTTIGADVAAKLTGQSKTKVDKRARNENEQEMKRQRLEKEDDKQLPIYAKKFSEEAIKAEGRRPKKKVAVLIGYAGTGYKGMQLSVVACVELEVDKFFTTLTIWQGARPEAWLNHAGSPASARCAVPAGRNRNQRRA